MVSRIRKCWRSDFWFKKHLSLLAGAGAASPFRLAGFKQLESRAAREFLTDGFTGLEVLANIYRE